MRIEYHPTYFVGERPGGVVTAVLLFDRISPNRRRERRVLDAIEFRGDTQDEADRKMIEWIDANAATEKPVSALAETGKGAP